MTKGIMAQDISFSAGTHCKNKNVLKTAETGFSKIMKQNLKPEKEEKSTSLDNKNMVSDEITEKTEAKGEIQKESKIENTDTKVENTDTKVENTDEKKVNQEISSVDKESVTVDVTQIEELLATKIKDILDLSDEELDTMLSELGLTMTDLFNPLNLQKLILNVNQATDITQALTNENLRSNLNDLMKELENIPLEKELMLTPEELNLLLETSLKAEGQNSKPDLDEVVEFADKGIKPQQENKEVDMDVSETKPMLTISVTKDLHQTNMGSSSEAADEDATMESVVPKEATKTTPFETIVQNLEVANKQNTNSIEAFDRLATVKQMSEIVDQVVEHIKVSIKPGISSMEMQLNPENLGKVNLTVTSTNGILTANLVTQNEVTKQALETQMIVLKDNLANQGIKVDAIEVTVSNFAFEQNHNSSNNEETAKKSQNNKLNGFESDIDELSEAMTADIMKQNGNSVDYTA